MAPSSVSSEPLQVGKVHRALLAVSVCSTSHSTASPTFCVTPRFKVVTATPQPPAASPWSYLKKFEIRKERKRERESCRIKSPPANSMIDWAIA